MKTNFIEVAQFGADLENMQKFAASFGHEIKPKRNGKTFAFMREGKVFGYADILYLPVAIPAFHPDLTTPRGIVEVIHGWKAQCQFNNSGDGLIAVPIAEQRKTFPDAQIQNAGFENVDLQLYALRDPETK